jgi:hypothetical protein
MFRAMCYKHVARPASQLVLFALTYSTDVVRQKEELKSSLSRHVQALKSHNLLVQLETNAAFTFRFETSGHLEDVVERIWLRNLTGSVSWQALFELSHLLSAVVPTRTYEFGDFDIRFR